MIIYESIVTLNVLCGNYSMMNFLYGKYKSN